MDYRSRRRRRRRNQGLSVSLPDIFTLNKIVKYILIALVILVVLLPVMYFWYARDLPTPGKLVAAKYGDSTRIYDRNNVLLYSVYQDQNRSYVPLNNIDQDLRNATIAIEDENFYKNQGFDPTAPLRIGYNLILKHRLIGGSGITQQLVKNVLLNPERNLSRKVKELILSIQVAKRYSKDQILEMYLNNIPYGGTAIGSEAAAETYFGKTSHDLTLAEAAFLAGLPQSPSLYSPFSGNKYYLGRSQDVLRQMVRNHYITQKQADDAFMQIKGFTFTQHAGSIKAPHFVMYVKQLLADKFGEQVVESGGLQVTTTLDYDLEKKSEDIVKNQIDDLKAYKVSNGAAMVTNPKTGEILAMVGSKDYFDTSIDGNYNDALAPRQPGSSLKPIIYAKAFEKGYTPATMLMDVPTDFRADETEKPYTPVNYDGKFRGPVQIRFALGNSLNIPAVKTLALVGIKDAMQKAYDMGIKNWEPTDQNMRTVGYSLVLGGRETPLYDEMTAYGVFANKGVRQDLYSIQKVTDRNGKVLYENKKKEGNRVLSEEVSYLISHILLDNVARTAEFGPNSYLRIPGKTVSVKTGTTDEKRDNWTVGYTPSYVVGVWVGNNDNTPMNQAIASGITGASPIWSQIMTAVLKGKPDEQPTKPDDVVALQIDSVVGGLPIGSRPTRSDYFIKGTEPTGQSPYYANKDGKEYYWFHEDDPISKDGKNRWQDGINTWIEQNHKDDPMYHPPEEVTHRKDEPTPTPAPDSSHPTDTPTPSQTP